MRNKKQKQKQIKKYSEKYHLKRKFNDLKLQGTAKDFENNKKKFKNKNKRN